MSGISRIQKGREDFRRPQETREVGKEIWLKDGEQMFLTSIATGEENDTFLDEIYLYTSSHDLIDDKYIIQDTMVLSDIIDDSGHPGIESHKNWANYLYNEIRKRKYVS